jgi:alanyl-tRNA synthetase
MAKQKAQGRAAGKFKMDRALDYTGASNTFVGYESLQSDAKVLALYADGSPVQALEAGQMGVVVLDTTPFYAESGGQVGDAGELKNEDTSVCFTVNDTQKIRTDVFGHYGVLQRGSLKVGDLVQAQVNSAQRLATARHHSATHLMHQALREVLGEHVQQKGSLVTPERTRFDFAHSTPLTEEQIREVEMRVNAQTLGNLPTQAREMALDAAQQAGAMMLFGEKYGDTVRVLDIGTSRELCGGTHVRSTGDIGLFKVVAQSGVAAGIRRIEAMTGQAALAHIQALEAHLIEAAQSLKTTPHELSGRLQQWQAHVKTLEKEVESLKGQLASQQGDVLLRQAVDVSGQGLVVKVLAAQLEGADAKTLRDTVDQLKNKLHTAAIVLASVEGEKVQLVAGVTSNLNHRLKAGELVNFVAAQVGGKGGGKPDLAMAGGTQPKGLPTALEKVKVWIAENLAKTA